MRYYVTIGTDDEPYRCRIRFDETAGGLVARVESGDGDVEPVAVPIDYCSLERGRGLHVIVGDESHDFYLDPVPGGFLVHHRGERIAVEVADERELLAKSIHGPSQSGLRVIRASMPGIVVSVDVAQDAVVTDGATLVVLEAMKMQNPIVSDGAGRVAEVHVRAGQAVAAGDALVTLD